MRYDAVVIGAGLPGLLAAWKLAEGGFRVAVLERGTIASESSALAAGHIPQESTSPANLAVLLRTRAIIDELDRVSGGMVRFLVVGGLQMATSEEGASALRARVDPAARLGVAGEYLDPDIIASRWPNLRTDDLAGGYYTGTDGFVFSQTLSVVLAGMARNAGAEIWEGCAVDRLAVDGGHVSGVVASGHHVTTPRVLVAAGAWSATLLARSRIFLPTESFVLQAVIVVGDHGGLRFMSEFEAGHYVMPRSPGTLLLGLPPSDIGVDVDRFSRHPDPETATEWLGLLRRRVPSLRDARVAGGWAGVLASTPDAWPLVGRFGPEGLFVATGFGGGGVQRLATAEAVAQLMLEQEPFYDIRAQEALRFNGYDGAPFEFREGPFYYTETAATQLW
ncbi:NAD(P)/FAD-dependent oxidoreductase [Candidatus Spongiisocius sp.]|uniref:NAD(P)/FAD-dependent oxidoreductase n=1 Tax=Candidatus Spongiisocius sp. TaxID=3101273 RepID=UPI003B5BA032